MEGEVLRLALDHVGVGRDQGPVKRGLALADKLFQRPRLGALEDEAQSLEQVGLERVVLSLAEDVGPELGAGLDEDAGDGVEAVAW